MSDTKEELSEMIAVLRAANKAVPAGSTLTEARAALGELIKRESGESNADAESLALTVDVVVEAAQLIATLVLAAALATSPTKVGGFAAGDRVPLVPLPPETPAKPIAEESTVGTPDVPQ